MCVCVCISVGPPDPCLSYTEGRIYINISFIFFLTCTHFNVFVCLFSNESENENGKNVLYICEEKPAKRKVKGGGNGGKTHSTKKE